MGDSQKKKLTEEQKARLATDISTAFKQIEEEEVKKGKLKLFCEKLIKENSELKADNADLLLRLTKLEQELSDTKKELSDVKEELVKTNKLLAETVLEQKKQKEVIILLSEQFKILKTKEQRET